MAWYDKILGALTHLSWSGKAVPDDNHVKPLRDIDAVSRAMADAAKEKSSYLRLANMGLTEVPDAVFKLQHLQFIDLSGNRLTSVPNRLRTLPLLRHVDLKRNPLVHLPYGLRCAIDAEDYQRLGGQVDGQKVEVVADQDTGLAAADFLIHRFENGDGPAALTLRDGGPLTEGRPPGETLVKLISALESFNALKSLILENLVLDEMPTGIRCLKNLRHLRCSGTGLKELPDWLGEIDLEILQVEGNDLVTFPAGRFSRLRHLHLSRNPLQALPRAVCQMPALEWLEVAACGLSEIPRDILQTPKLKSIWAMGNPITSPPPEVMANGLAAIRDYWRQREEAGVDYLCEAKLIILGEPGAGKTSLAQKIKDAGYKLVPDQKSTEGIEVIRHSFPVALQVEDNGAKKKTLNRDFQASMWDFGGQEIYHATHQFFLTRRSVYVLVCDDRKEDTDFAYWLQAVELLSDGSPLLIVQNEKQNRKRDINLASLRARFANLRGALAVNLETNAGLAQAVQTIEKELQSLPHIGTGLPATWKRVREALEQDPRDYISEKEFLDICGDNGFTRDDDKRQLSGYLHDLGICLHFQDDPLLKKTVVLKPSWGTDAVYRVLDAPEIIKARGHFTKAQLKGVWSEAKYAGMHDELLQLMMKFQLCYALEDGKRCIAPQMLSPDPPAYAWDAAENVVVRYEYAFMPKGIITRFIVALHQRIAGGNKVWKTGVVLERDGSQAQVIEDYPQRRITVRVNGPAFQGLLAIVDEHLERLHASFPRLQCERYLPCPCEECRAKTSPEGFELGKLLNMARKGREIQCHASGEMVDAAALVRNILPGALAVIEREGLKASMGEMEMECNPSKLPVTPAPLVPEVYVSYAWNKESEEITERLKQALEPKGIKLIRDKDELRYKDSIRDFMRRLGRGKAVVVVISAQYLQSENCMFEMLEIAKSEGVRNRIFPIILSDANIFKATGRLAYVQHWEEQIQVLDTGLKGVRGDNLATLQEDLTLYSDIRRLIDGITGTLRDMNCLSARQHLESDFAQLIQSVEEQRQD